PRESSQVNTACYPTCSGCGFRSITLYGCLNPGQICPVNIAEFTGSISECNRVEVFSMQTGERYGNSSFINFHGLLFCSGVLGGDAGGKNAFQQSADKFRTA